MRRLVVIAGALPALAGCGVLTTAPAGPPTAYRVQVTETLPSAPRPLAVVWDGTISARTWRWSGLTERIGGGAPTPVDLSGPASAQTAAAGALAALVRTAATGGPWPADPVPLVPGRLAQTPAFHPGAHAQGAWRTTWALQGAVRVPVDVTADERATLAQGRVEQGRWSLTVRSEATRVRPPHGQAFTLPELEWRVQGSLVPAAS
ncbi:MAG: hypothetical protein K6U87_08070 [Firmicutes bacterium]|nr:hypothetical protein [Bacillota bacterium]